MQSASSSDPPKFCPMRDFGDVIEDAVEEYKLDPLKRELALTSARVEAEAYGRWTRVEPVSFCCKAGGVDKCEIGLEQEAKILEGFFESICNPVAQARSLNEIGTEMNVMMGLCVGHDMLFLKEVKAPTTVLVVKDRVMGHNPAAALYLSPFYYRKLFSV